MDLSALERFAHDHHGLVTRQAAADRGVARSTWFRALGDGRLIGVHPGVARLPGAPVTRTQRIAAAVFAAGSGAMASHRSAAYLWGVPRPDDDPVDIMVPARTCSPTISGAIVHRPRDRRDLSPVLRHNVRVANVLRFLCDLGAVDEPSVHSAVGHVLFQRLARAHHLAAAVRVHARRGRHGVPALRRALEDWMLDGRPADSVLESMMHRLLRVHGLPPAEFHPRIAGYVVDFWLIDTPVVIECDGWEYHGRTMVQHDRDTRRDNDIVLAGYIPVHVTYRMVRCDPAEAARRIRGALARWSVAG